MIGSTRPEWYPKHAARKESYSACAISEGIATPASQPSWASAGILDAARENPTRLAVCPKSASPPFPILLGPVSIFLFLTWPVMSHEARTCSLSMI